MRAEKARIVSHGREDSPKASEDEIANAIHIADPRYRFVGNLVEESWRGALAVELVSPVCCTEKPVQFVFPLRQGRTFARQKTVDRHQWKQVPHVHRLCPCDRLQRHPINRHAEWVEKNNRPITCAIPPSTDALECYVCVFLEDVNCAPAVKVARLKSSELLTAPRTAFDESELIEWRIDFESLASRPLKGILRCSFDFLYLRKQSLNLVSPATKFDVPRSGKSIDVMRAKRLVLQRLDVCDEVLPNNFQLQNRPRPTKLRIHDSTERQGTDFHLWGVYSLPSKV